MGEWAPGNGFLVVALLVTRLGEREEPGGALGLRLLRDKFGGEAWRFTDVLTISDVFMQLTANPRVPPATDQIHEFKGAQCGGHWLATRHSHDFRGHARLGYRRAGSSHSSESSVANTSGVFKIPVL